MLAPTHLLAGQLAYLGTAWWVGHHPAWPEALTAMAASLLPDIDTRCSLVGRLLPWLSGPLEDATGHRTVTHSLLAILVVGALAVLLLPAGYTLAVVAGFASHSILDMMTISGVAWFWPFLARCVLPGERRWRMEVMGTGEIALAVVLALLMTPTLLLAERGGGILGTVRDALGDLAGARHHYDAHRGEAVWQLVLKGQDNRRFQEVSGRFRVIGPYGNDGFLVATGSGPVSVCQAERCDWYAERAVIERGAPLETTTRRLSGEAIAREELEAAIRPLQRVGRLYLRGEVVGEVAAQRPVIEATADGAELRYATPGQLMASMEGQELASVRLWVQVRHQPGNSVPQLRGLEREEEAAIPARLKEYLP